MDLSSARQVSLDNDRDNRVAAQRLVVSGADDKIGVSQSFAKRCFRKRKPRLRFIALLYSHYPFRAVLPRHQETAECDGGLQPISYQVDFSVQVTPTAWSDTLRSLEGARIRPLFQIREIQQLLVDLLRPQQLRPKEKSIRTSNEDEKHLKTKREKNRDFYPGNRYVPIDPKGHVDVIRLFVVGIRALFRRTLQAAS